MTSPANEPPIEAIEPSVSAFQIRWPMWIRNQVEQYAHNLGVPINSAVMIFIDAGLKAAGFPGAAGYATTVKQED